MTLDQYLTWVLERVPKDIPDEIMKKSLDLGGYVSGLQFWMYGERGPDYVVFTASDENELKCWMYSQVCKNIALQTELRHRQEEEKLWRYVQTRAEEGHWLYRENKNYIYNAIYDSRKYWMEYHLSLGCIDQLERQFHKKTVNKSSLIRKFSVRYKP